MVWTEFIRRNSGRVGHSIIKFNGAQALPLSVPSMLRRAWLLFDYLCVFLSKQQTRRFGPPLYILALGLNQPLRRRMPCSHMEPRRFRERQDQETLVLETQNNKECCVLFSKLTRNLDDVSRV